MKPLNQRLGPASGRLSIIATAVLCACCLTLPVPGAEELPKDPLALRLPAPTAKGTPEDLPLGPNVEPLSDKPRPPFMVVRGVTNVALGKAVTSSIPPASGELKQLTDGKKEAVDADAIEFKKGTQWVQVDFGAVYPVHAIVFWHDHRYIQVMHDVILQASTDPDFKDNVATLFNNDIDNSSSLGTGADREYFETAEGKIVDAKGVKARYVRGYTRGSSLGGLNGWQELEVYALPQRE